MTDGWIAFWAAIGGAVLGPFVADKVQARTRHLSSLRAILAENIANAHDIVRQRSVLEKSYGQTFDIGLFISPRLMAYRAAASDASLWTPATASVVHLCYGQLEALQRDLGAHDSAIPVLLATSLHSEDYVARREYTEQAFQRVLLQLPLCLEGCRRMETAVRAEVERLEGWEVVK